MSEIRRFTKLETLDMSLDFTVVEEDVEGEDEIRHSCNIVALQHLNMLHGELTLRGLENVKDPKDADRANLKEKHKLGRLKLVWNGELCEKDVAAAVLQSLQPTLKLTDMTIIGYRGSRWPSWMTDNRYQLKHLKFEDIRSSTLLFPPVGQLPHLETLTLKKVSALKKIEFDTSQLLLFPLLRELFLIDMENLEEVLLLPMITETYVGIFRCLTILHIENCPCLTHLWLTSSIKQLRLKGNVDILLSCLSNIRVDDTESSSVKFYYNGVIHSNSSLPQGQEDPFQEIMARTNPSQGSSRSLPPPSADVGSPGEEWRAFDSM